MQDSVLSKLVLFLSSFTGPYAAVFLAHCTAVLCAVLFFSVALTLNRLLFKRVLRQNELHLKFAYSLINLLCVIGSILLLGVLLGYSRDLGKILLGSTGLVIAIIGFAAQNTIGDVIAGVMIGLTKPFKIGDKITIEDMNVSGTVRDMTVRHTVLHQFSGLYVIIPNSVLNHSVVHNATYRNNLTGSYLEFGVSYTSDIETAMKIIHDAVIGCRYTVEYAGDDPELRLAAVYMTGFDSSAIKLRTTVWSRNADENFLARSDIMLRVKKDFEKYGIEIPYNYLNVIQKENVVTAPAQSMPDSGIYKTNFEEVRHSIATFCNAYHLDHRTEGRLTLLAEELFGIMSDYLGDGSYFDITMNGTACAMTLNVNAILKSSDRKDLAEMSGNGGDSGLTGIIRRIVGNYSSGIVLNKQWSLHQYREDLAHGDVSSTDIGKTILATLADDVLVNIRGNGAEVVVIKEVGQKPVS